MKILNCMWSADAPFYSVHKVISLFIDIVNYGQQKTCFFTGDAHAQSFFKDAESLQCPKKYIKNFIGRYFVRRWWLKKILSEKPDLLLIDGLGMARLLLPLLSKIGKTRVIIFFHGETRFKGDDKKIFEKNKNYSPILVAVSFTLAKKIEEQLNGYNVHAIPTCLRLKPTLERNIISYKEKNSITFAAVGRLVADKNFMFLIDLINELNENDKIVRLLIAGEGKLSIDLQEKINKLGLTEKVFLVGYQPDMQDFYKNADILLVPSLQEGQGLVIQEAIHYGVPVVCSDLDVFREQLGGSGVYCDPYSLNAWVESCRPLLDLSQARELFQKQNKDYSKYNSEFFYRKRCADLMNNFKYNS